MSGYHPSETFVIGSREAIEAEYGYDVEAPYGIVCFVADEFISWIPMADRAACKAELAEAPRGAVSYL